MTVGFLPEAARNDAALSCLNGPSQHEEQAGAAQRTVQLAVW
jgi:hypothetical protein